MYEKAKKRKSGVGNIIFILGIAVHNNWERELVAEKEVGEKCKLRCNDNGIWRKLHSIVLKMLQGCKLPRKIHKRLALLVDQSMGNSH